MITSVWQWTSALLLLACLTSFGWAMQRFFTQPSGQTGGMKVVKVFGILFGILHLTAIVVTPLASIAQGLTGAALYACSLGLFWWAITANLRRPLSAAFSSDLPSHLVLHGPYKLIRHPLYCSYLLCWLAGWVATGRLWLAPTVAVMLVIYLVAAAGEEKKFEQSLLAENYEQYRARTGLFFPNLFRRYSGGKRFRATAT
jgi:protein-S-isoprenylcysteine O-methyltransferase Ste14